MSIELILLLAMPLLGAVTLGAYGARRWAPDLNVEFSLATFLAACAQTARFVDEGTQVVLREQFLIDPFNVFLVILTAFVGLTTTIFSRPYMRVEREHGRVSTAQLAHRARAPPIHSARCLRASTSRSSTEGAGA